LRDDVELTVVFIAGPARWLRTLSRAEDRGEGTTYLDANGGCSCWLELLREGAREVARLMPDARRLPPAGHPIVVTDGSGALGGGPW
jgi:hypothetical protein